MAQVKKNVPPSSKVGSLQLIIIQLFLHIILNKDGGHPSENSPSEGGASVLTAG